MVRNTPSSQHLNSSDDLVTPYSAIRSGFVSLALEKNRRATPFVEQARVLKAAVSRIKTPMTYLALGELKGGIDPAGADEHWKTARSALQRINQAFMTHGLKPHTFFIGAAIEKKMASEIWHQLEEGTLTNAANLTHDTQLASISRWLCNL